PSRRCRSRRCARTRSSAGSGTPRSTTRRAGSPRTRRSRSRAGGASHGEGLPTHAAEVEAVNRDLTRYVAFIEEEDGGDFTANDLRVLAEHHWPGKNVRVKSGPAWYRLGRVQPGPCQRQAEDARSG